MSAVVCQQTPGDTCDKKKIITFYSGQNQTVKKRKDCEIETLLLSVLTHTSK